ncbi:MAG: hypothetical protein BWX70_02089 [Verrucomicrobia bacterium ADurb.Bin070]|nr:MAG: hypothetical protein BWX70_02089 [Verrucomicrobia bacterium ADurb.Bin070]
MASGVRLELRPAAANPEAGGAAADDVTDDRVIRAGHQLDAFGEIVGDGVVTDRVAVRLPDIEAVVAVAGERVAGERVAVAGPAEIDAVALVVRKQVAADRITDREEVLAVVSVEVDAVKDDAVAVLRPERCRRRDRVARDGVVRGTQQPDAGDHVARERIILDRVAVRTLEADTDAAVGADHTVAHLAPRHAVQDHARVGDRCGAGARHREAGQRHVVSRDRHGHAAAAAIDRGRRGIRAGEFDRLVDGDVLVVGARRNAHRAERRHRVHAALDGLELIAGFRR